MKLDGKNIICMRKLRMLITHFKIKLSQKKKTHNMFLPSSFIIGQYLL